MDPLNWKGKRLYKEKGFTDAIIEKLGSGLKRKAKFAWSYGYYTGTLSSMDLLSIERLIPAGMKQKERQNYSPTLGAFIEVAKREPKAFFIVHVVPKDRPDERITVEGACIPVERKDLIDFLKRKALGPPDVEGLWGKVRRDITVHGKTIHTPSKYYCVWWD
jgi:hypothetical protein